ncbi:MAG: DUF192 domain-containing protein [Myxococcales bacterium]|nr:DUF192 domain-containing protein [Myxococcales bacterium]
MLACKQHLEPVPGPANHGAEDVADAAAKRAAATPTAVVPSASATLAEVRFPDIKANGEPLRVKVEVVASEARIIRGLMHRTFMPADQGMLFLMGTTAVHSFWMHNTLIPLDMIFIDKDFTIVGIVANAVPKTDTSRYVDKPSLYVLEVNGGWAAQHGVAAGSKVEFFDVERLAK